MPLWTSLQDSLRRLSPSEYSESWGGIAWPQAFESRRWLYFTGIASLGVNALFLWPLLAHFVSTHDFGQFAFGLAVITAVSPLAAAGLHMYVLRETADADHTAQQLGSAVAAISLTWLTVIVLVLVPAVLARQFVIALIAASFAMAAGLTAISHARGLHRPCAFAVLTLFVQTVALAAGGVALAVTDSESMAFLTLSLFCIAPAAWYRHRAIHIDEPMGTRRRLLSGALRFSLPLVPHLVLVVVLLQGVRVLIGITLGFDASASFQFAATLGGFSITLAILLNGNWSATALRHEEPEFRTYCEQYGAWLGSATALGALCTTVAVLIFLPLWLPSGYDEHEIALAALFFLPAAPLQAFGDLQSTVAMKIRRSQAVSLATISGAAVAVVAVVVAAPHIGILAGGLSVSVGLLVRAMVAYFAQRGTEIPPVVVSRLLYALVLSVLIAAVGAVLV